MPDCCESHEYGPKCYHKLQLFWILAILLEVFFEIITLCWERAHLSFAFEPLAFIERNIKDLHLLKFRNVKRGNTFSECHCVKNVHIRSFSGPYSVQMREIQTKKTPSTNTFYAELSWRKKCKTFANDDGITRWVIAGSETEALNNL